MAVSGPGINIKEESAELITADPILLKYEAKLPETSIYGNLPNSDKSLKNHYVTILLSSSQFVH